MADDKSRVRNVVLGEIIDRSFEYFQGDRREKPGDDSSVFKFELPEMIETGNDLDSAYMLVTENKNLSNVLTSAEEMGYIPERFCQTNFARKNAHLRLRREDNTKGFARLTSEREDGNMVYRLYAPVTHDESD